MQSLNSIHEYGATVFGAKELYLTWLRTPNVDFGGTKPHDLLYDINGLEKVMNLLYQIQSKKKDFKQQLQDPSSCQIRR